MSWRTAAPDWGDDGVVTAIDPTHSTDNGVETIAFDAPTTARTWRVGIARREAAQTASVTLNITVDGVPRFGATRTLQAAQLWRGATIAWNGRVVTITGSDDVDNGFACVGQTCQAGDVCGSGATDLACLEQPGGNIFGSGALLCAECGVNNACGTGEECREGYCLVDGADRGAGGSCASDLDCADALTCSPGGICGTACDTVTCFLAPDLCCPANQTCGFDGFCG